MALTVGCREDARRNLHKWGDEDEAIGDKKGHGTPAYLPHAPSLPPSLPARTPNPIRAGGQIEEISSSGAAEAKRKEMAARQAAAATRRECLFPPLARRHTHTHAKLSSHAPWVSCSCCRPFLPSAGGLFSVISFR